MCRTSSFRQCRLSGAIVSMPSISGYVSDWQRLSQTARSSSFNALNIGLCVGRDMIRLSSTVGGFNALNIGLCVGQKRRPVRKSLVELFQCPQYRAMCRTAAMGIVVIAVVFQCPQYRAMCRTCCGSRLTLEVMVSMPSISGYVSDPTTCKPSWRKAS